MGKVPDPYQALNLPHTATDDQIKRSYRDLARKYHPDRLSQRSGAERAEATTLFAKISAAYDLLADPRRKAQYDHIYKFGGYDEEDEIEARRNVQYASSADTGPYPAPPTSYQQHQSSSSTTRKRKQTGIGYTCVDPLAFLWTNGRVQSKMAVAGIQIPSRLGMATNKGGFRFAFSSGRLSTSPTTGVRQFKTQTTQFCHGKKFTRTETTTIHPDGRREVVIEGNDYYERRFVPPASASADAYRKNHDDVTQPKKNEPWYANAWNDMKNKLTMCYNPCMVTSQ